MIFRGKRVCFHSTNKLLWHLVFDELIMALEFEHAEPIRSTICQD